MTQDEFEKIFAELTGLSKTVLVDKAKEYAADGDRMHNFKIAATLTDGTPEQALWGMLAKHIVSVRDMVLTGDPYPQAVWDEKIGDAVNYFILLRALIVDTNNLIPVTHPTN